jgi:hypothetical protein
VIKLLENKNINRNGNYVRIPKSILKFDELDNIRICIYIYLCRKRALDDTVYFSINALLANSGYKISNHKNKTSNKFVSILNEFASKSYFIDYSIFENYKLNECVEVTLNIDKFDVLENFGIIFLNEIDKILNFKLHIAENKKLPSITPSKLLLILSFIRIHKSRRSPNQNKHPEKKPEIYYRRYIDLAADLNMYPDTVSLGVKILSELDLIVCKELPRRKNEDNNWRSRTNIFVDKYDGWEQELQWGEELLMKSQ